MMWDVSHPRFNQINATAASPDVPRNVPIPTRNYSALYHFGVRTVGHVAAVANDLTTSWHAMGVDYGRRFEN
ncbi:hypothetical protein DBV15_00922 [Temnothorax longispinosus]|uniref:Uncharacterized protein n=1 Tax=Temnothorax longispinosus TaxID=300112 RepID=A0A4S2JB66_9HYME|nr:hypothetical protein DBV15_00922 [Temnothorax longispinosus]